jgi:hypothetical protein
VQPARHQIVHKVVAAGNAMKDIVDQSLLVAGADILETVGGFHAAGGRYALL